MKVGGWDPIFVYLLDLIKDCTLSKNFWTITRKFEQSNYLNMYPVSSSHLIISLICLLSYSNVFLPFMIIVEIISVIPLLSDYG